MGFVERSGFWLLLVFVLTLVIERLIPGSRGGLTTALNVLSLVLLLICGGILLYRWTFKHLLWKVRNRLIVTYLLMGLTPVVLFIILATISAYVFAGQFATFAATEQLNDLIARLSAENRALAVHVGHSVAVSHGAPGVVQLPDSAEVASMSGDSSVVAVEAWDNGRPVKLTGGQSLKLTPVEANAIPLPNWVPSRFRGVVFLNRRLFLCAVDKLQTPGHAIALVSAMPLDGVTLRTLARGLGIMRILPAVNLQRDTELHPNARIVRRSSKALDVDAGGEEISGGILPPPIYFFDNRVTFGAPLPTTDWTSGHPAISLLSVTSRPTLLYGKLFGTALQVGDTVRDALIAIAVLFAVLELIAFIMAVRLNRTITRSIADLYGATMAIDRGDFNHRIRVQRRDQLGVLSTSFNSMSESLQKLLEQQREKERMQSELAIAQEVQNNLFPQGEIKIPGLELHGICKPARTVSGDYYDFLLMGKTELCLALGDISGKGISAALLMAGLHSAVRAYRFAGEDCEENANSGFTGIATFSSPGKVLSLLNRHLYRSTAPEKYATLFLAHYDAHTRKLTYSNGGQLPPLVLCANGQIKRLDCGGSVVGLLNNMRYDEASITLDPGDLLVAYSDGVTEPENDFGEFGEDRLMEIVKRHRHQPLAVISSQTLQALRGWIGDGEQPDDITLVLARQM
ncbi:MAG: PP2C family protein-serine/threonine phosphatase [Acidobacteriaceae bacterium]